MVDEQTGSENNGAAANGEDEETMQFAPEINIEAQYVKDLSFENPMGPLVPPEARTAPEISVDVTTGGRPVGNGRYEVTLQFRAEAATKESTVFILELTYGGIMTVSNVPDEAINAILLIEGARLIFPFARNIIADVTRDGGFPPLFLQPIDFINLYRSQHAE